MPTMKEIRTYYRKMLRKERQKECKAQQQLVIDRRAIDNRRFAVKYAEQKSELHKTKAALQVRNKGKFGLYKTDSDNLNTECAKITQAILKLPENRLRQINLKSPEKKRRTAVEVIVDKIKTNPEKYANQVIPLAQPRKAAKFDIPNNKLKTSVTQPLIVKLPFRVLDDPTKTKSD